eukprot:TRINITY_DN818_c0_g1_i2.p1 TRINITY_DN818_c0_g1~~TRINITY_DN818_c0_g1_i2.p1  ORF type:complete len:111 (+),score=25.76 TRINITY_DN818_c0_g1_i2:307-639(+)
MRFGSPRDRFFYYSIWAIAATGLTGAIFLLRDIRAGKIDPRELQRQIREDPSVRQHRLRVGSGNTLKRVAEEELEKEARTKRIQERLAERRERDAKAREEMVIVFPVQDE